MSLLRYPRIQPLSEAGPLGGGDVLVDSGTTDTFWTEFGSPTWAAGQVTFDASNERILSPFSRYFSPFYHDVEIDVSFTIAAGTGTTRLRIGVISDSNRLSTCNSGLELNVGSDKRVRFGTKWRNSAASPTLDDYNSGILTNMPVRLRMILRKESWTDTTAGSQVEIYVYSAGYTDDSDYDDSYTGTFEDPGLGSNEDHWMWWNKAANSIDDWGNAHAAISLEFQTGGGTESATITDCTVRYANQQFTAGTVHGPVMDGQDLELPTLPAQTYREKGFLIPSLAPFSADNTGVVDATAALQSCGNYAKDYGMVHFLEADSVYRISDTLTYQANCYQRTNATPADRQSFSDEINPAHLQGSNQGSSKSRIVLNSGSSGFDVGSYAGYKPMLEIINSNYQTDPPDAEHKPNSSYQHSVVNVGLHIESGNDGAVGIYMLGAQGCEALRVDITADNSGYAGIVDPPGSGGHLNSFTITGTLHGVVMANSQPGPTLSGFVTDVRGSALLTSSNGSRGTTTCVGWDATQAANTVAFDCDSVATTAGTTFLTERGHMCFVDCKIDFATLHAGNTVCTTDRALVMRNCWVRNATNLTGGAVGAVANPADEDEWVWIKKLVIPLDPPTLDSGGLTSPDPFPYQADTVIDGVQASATIFEYETGGTPPADLCSKHRLADDVFKTWEDADYDAVDDWGAVGDGITDDEAALNAGLAAMSAGEVAFIPRGIFLCNDTVDMVAGIHLVGAGKQVTTLMAARAPGAAEPFGASDTARPLLRTADSATPSYVQSLALHKPSSTDTGFALHWRCPGSSFLLYLNRQAIDGFGAYPNVGTTDQVSPYVLVEGANAGGRHFHWNQGVKFNIAAGYSHVRCQDAGNTLTFYGANVEHADIWGGNFYLDGCERVIFYGFKGEGNWPLMIAVDCENVLMYGIAGNHTGYIPDGVLPPGEVEDVVDDTTGYNPEPAGFDEPGVPALVYFYDCTNYEVCQMQDECRNDGTHTVFGNGTRADYWHFGAEFNLGSLDVLLDEGVRPAMWAKGDVDETIVLPDVVITDADDETFRNAETGIPISGTGFGASQGVGFVKICPTDDIDDVTGVLQTVTAWTDTSITITCVRSGLPLNTNVYLFVENNDGTSNAAGYVVQIVPANPVITGVDPSVFEDGETGILITGSNFGSSQGSNGYVTISPTDDINDVGAVEQTVVSWSTTSIGITAVQGALDADTPYYLFVFRDALASNLVGEPVQFEEAPTPVETWDPETGAGGDFATFQEWLQWHRKVLKRKRGL